MANQIYNVTRTNLLKSVYADLSASGTEVRAMLMTTAYVPNATHATRVDVKANEATGTGYTLGGNILATKTVTAGTGTGVFTAANTSWTSSTITARGVIVYRVVTPGTPADTDPLLCYLDFGSALSSSSGTFQITWNAAGILIVS